MLLLESAPTNEAGLLGLHRREACRLSLEGSLLLESLRLKASRLAHERCTAESSASERSLLPLELGLLELLLRLLLPLELGLLLLELVRLLLGLKACLHRVLKPLLLAPLCHLQRSGWLLVVVVVVMVIDAVTIIETRLEDGENC